MAEVKDAPTITIAHAPLPWSHTTGEELNFVLDAHGDIICLVSPATAVFIVEAANDMDRVRVIDAATAVKYNHPGAYAVAISNVLVAGRLEKVAEQIDTLGTAVRNSQGG